MEVKKLYTLLDENDFVTHCQWFVEGQHPENAVEEMVTEYMAKAKYNRATKTFTDESTDEEYQEKVNKIANGFADEKDKTDFLQKHGTKKQKKSKK